MVNWRFISSEVGESTSVINQYIVKYVCVSFQIFTWNLDWVYKLCGGIGFGHEKLQFLNAILVCIWGLCSNRSHCFNFIVDHCFWKLCIEGPYLLKWESLPRRSIKQKQCFKSLQKRQVVKAVAVNVAPSPSADSAEYRQQLCHEYGFRQIGEPLPNDITLRDIIDTLPKKVLFLFSLKRALVLYQLKMLLGSHVSGLYRVSTDDPNFFAKGVRDWWCKSFEVCAGICNIICFGDFHDRQSPMVPTSSSLGLDWNCGYGG